ncbi:NADH-quinone oxidoreductase subunit L [Campylobacter sp.]|uniref:NADH-quinone oxidoreductase subunit L n=1 Tax=Campylobacter sp. TaxID=205 RepID=UPI0026FD1BC4|nr:NADH-quinone oxidoreductase subunit L [Campylobacter sp.]
MALFIVSLFAPLLSSAFAGVFSHARRFSFIGMVCSFFIIVSTLSSLVLLNLVGVGGAIEVYIADFIIAGGFESEFSFILDEISVIMMCVVGVVASVVHVYSISYMSGDLGFNRYFSYLGLFVFSMLVLVTSDNFIGLFIGWEGVGLCSWLLIGFWYKKQRAGFAANEAFIMNRIADLGMLLGIFLIYKEFGSVRYVDVFRLASNLDNSLLALIAAFLFIGAMGKSAQFPFHTWLADAMEGPTPVSALIHAATMVTAGVYLVIRANSIFALTPEISRFIAYLGAFVAVFAALMAMVSSDLKKIIAYSTLSQLGYMFVAAGLGAYWIALFHLATHAFFKSLLFLCAGNVMHAMNDQLDIKKMGGLYKFMKITAVFMVIGSVALAGFYPFAGFFSKDKILEAAFSEGNFTVYVVLLAGAAMTAFYSFRLIMLVFFAKPKFTNEPHEANKSAIISLVPLVILAIFAGFFEHKFELLSGGILPKFSLDISSNTSLVMLASTLAIITLATLFAIFAYKKEIFTSKIEEMKIYKLLKNEYFIPKIYERVFINGYEKMARICRRLDEAAIDKSVDFVAYIIYKFANFSDGMQSGNLTLMLRLMVAGFVVLLTLAFVFKGI